MQTDSAEGAPGTAEVIIHFECIHQVNNIWQRLATESNMLLLQTVLCSKHKMGGALAATWCDPSVWAYGPASPTLIIREVMWGGVVSEVLWHIPKQQPQTLE
jgi:hypothetical protein